MKIFFIFLLFIFSYGLNLTKEEQEFIKTHKIKVVVTPNWEPFYLFENNKPLGISFDYFFKIAKKVDLKYEIEKIDKWTDVLKKIKNKQADITLSTTKTPDREKYALFTKVYLKYPIAFVTKNNYSFIASAKDLESKKVAVGKNYSAYKILHSKYPKINFIQVKNTKEALEYLYKDKVDVAIDILPVISYKLSKYSYNDLKISGFSEEKFNVQMMVRNDYKILVDILNKTLSSLTFEEKQNIYNKWIKVKVEQVNYKRYYFVIFIIFIVAIFIYFQNKHLKKINKVIQDYNSELKKTSLKLEEIIKTQDIIIDTIQEGIILSDVSNNYKIFKINKKVEEIFNLKEKDIINKNLLDFIDKKYLNIAKRNLKKEKIYSEEMVLNVNNKKIITLLAGSDTIIDGIKVRITTIVDITKLKEQEKILYESSKLALMGEMIGNIAHQWRQPLSTITVSASSIKLNKELNTLTDEFLDESIETIMSNAYYLSQTIDDFKNFLKDDKKKDKIYIEDIINTIKHLLKGAFKNNDIEVVINNNSKSEILIYKNELIQSLINILNNAKDALKDKELDLKVVIIDVEENKDNIIISILDNAGGIEDEIKNRIFEPYFTTKHKSQGTGLGLYMTYNMIVDSIGGEISVQNKNFVYKNKEYTGANFIIKIPKEI